MVVRLPLGENTARCWEQIVGVAAPGRITHVPLAEDGINEDVLESGGTAEAEDSVVPDEELEAILLDPNYTSRVEFALKLGYTELQVQIALQKLGPQPGQNELLAELIKLGASSCRSSAGTEGSVSGGSASSGTAGIMGVSATESLGSDDQRGSLENLASILGDRQDGHDDGSNLRPIVIDGSNVAMSHGNKEVFSCSGIKLCVDWFKSHGHKDITVFVPKWRKEASKPDARIIDQDILLDLEKERLLVFTPSRFVGGRRLVCYDDRYILKLAAETDGIVVSNDNYRDLVNENPEFKKVVDERLLMYSFVNDRFMPPDDPLGRHGPSLDKFLRRHPKAPESLPPPCPYGKKCTYGNKCKYYHPERGNQPQKSVTERLVEQSKIQIQEVKARGNKSRDSSPGNSLKPKLTGTVSAPASSDSKAVKKVPLSRTKSGLPSTMLTKELTEGAASGVLTDDAFKAPPHDHKDVKHDLGMFQDVGGGYLPPSSGYQQSPGLSLPSWPPSMSSGGSGQSPTWAHPGMSPIRNVGPSGSSSGLFYGDHGGHLSVAKRLSDPEKEATSPDSGGPNLHRKLQRQLTLNPLYDPRLFQIRSCIPPPHMMVPPPSSGRPGEAERLHDPHNQPHGGMEGHNPSSVGGGHRPLVRHSSTTEGHVLASGFLQPPPQWNKGATPGMVVGGDMGVHPSVTRIASAPEYCQWPPTRSNPPMQRLNSTSDTQLNLYHQGAASSYFSNEVYDVHKQQQVWGMPPHLGQWHQESAMPRPQTPLSHVAQQPPPLRPSSVPPHPQAAMTPSGEDMRNRLYFHLSSIFPQEQVQAAMMIYPEETNPQKICAAILSLFPPKGQ